MTPLVQELRIPVSESVGEVSGLLLRPDTAKVLLLLAHGAGAGMRHNFMESLSATLGERGVATLRYQFPYMEKESKRPDAEGVLTDTVRAAVTATEQLAGDLPLFAGGKSMGGRMTSVAAAKKPLPNVRGLVFFGFPLHAAGKPSDERGRHLMELQTPMLFLQGSRDTLSDLTLLRRLCARIGKRAELFLIEGGDHSFHMLKSGGRSDTQVRQEIADKTANWMGSLTHSLSK
jgi:predicted alpha/beta-hydrolase family hydrolase